MICSVGTWPRRNATKATEAQQDFKYRGGTLMIRRVISFRLQASSAEVISSICQFGKNSIPGFSWQKTSCVNGYKSRRTIVCNSLCDGFIRFSLPCSFYPFQNFAEHFVLGFIKRPIRGGFGNFAFLS